MEQSNDEEHLLDNANKKISKLALVCRCIGAIPHLGILLAISAALCYASEKIAAKDAVNYEVDPMAILVVSKFINFVSTLPMLAFSWKKELFFRAEMIYVIGYTVFVILGTWLLFYSLKFIPVLDVTVIANTNIVFSMILSAMFLGYKVSFYDTGIAFGMISGVVLMCKPSFIFGDSDLEVGKKNRFIGCTMGLCLSMSVSLFSYFNRKILKTDVFFISCVSSFSMFVVYLPGAIYGWKASFTLDFRTVFDLCVCGFIVTLGNIFHVKAIKLEEITNVSFGLIMGVPFTFILQWVILDTKAHLNELIGMVVILTCLIALLAKNKWCVTPNRLG